MAEVATIARPYAEAVFSIADSASALPAWSAALGRLSQVASQPEVLALLGDPRVSAAQLTELVVSVAGVDVAEARGLVAALVENQRLAAFPQLFEQFEQLKNARENAVDAQIESAFDMEPAQLSALVAGLEQKLHRKVRPSVRVNKDLIGGVCVTVGDQVMDGSVRGKLATMAARLADA